MKKWKKYSFLLLLPIVIFIFFITNMERKEIEVEAIAETKELEKVEGQKEEMVKQKFTVDIKGSVQKPGIYTLDEGSRVMDAIQMAGGLLEIADTSLINLSKKIEDEMVIIIYTQEEIKNWKKEKETKYEVIEIPCDCPDNQNNACIEENDEKINENRININTASLEQLLTIPGIGESKAQSIIEYRNIANFETTEDIKKVNGIGDSLFEKIKDYIMV